MIFISRLTRFLLSVLLLTSGLGNGFVLCVEKDGNSAVEVATETGHCLPCIDGNRPQEDSVVHASDCGCTDVPFADGSNYLASKNQHDSLKVVKIPFRFLAALSAVILNQQIADEARPDFPLRSETKIALLARELILSPNAPPVA